MFVFASANFLVKKTRKKSLFFPFKRKVFANKFEAYFVLVFVPLILLVKFMFFFALSVS